MTTLRARVIRLAAENPSLRAHLLPLLKEASSLDPRPFTRDDWMGYNGAEPFDGDYENEDPANQPLLGSVEFPRPVSLETSEGTFEVGSIVLVADRNGLQVEAWDPGTNEAQLFTLNFRPRNQAAAQSKMEWAAREFQRGDVDEFEHIGGL